MLDQILKGAGDPSAEADLCQHIADFVQSLRASAGKGDRSLVEKAEADVQADPKGAFKFDASGFATLTAAGNTWHAGRFETPSIAELRQRVAPADGSDARLWVLDGASPATDIGGLQATTGGRPLFQVASQFNCLESPGSYVTLVADISTMRPRDRERPFQHSRQPC